MRGVKLPRRLGGSLASLGSVRFSRWHWLKIVLLVVAAFNVDAKKHNVPTGASPEEANALLAFKDHLYSQRSLESWDLVKQPNYCAWDGVKCSDEGYVKILSLKQMGLVGNISPALARLSRLKSINLHRNYLFGPIPAELAGMKSLRQVKLSMNRLTGTLPAAFGRSSLSTLVLFNNNLTGPIPDTFANAIRVKQIRLGFNDMTGPIPTYLGDFTNLSVISLPGNGFSGSIPSQLGRLSTLLGLTLDRNPLSGGIPDALFNCHSLRNITLNQTGLSGTISPAISALTDLALLDLGGNAFSGSIPSELGSLKKLRLLDLHGNNFTGTLPDTIGQLTNLTLLDLSFLPGVNSSVPASLFGLSLLKRVDFTNSSFYGPLPNGLIAALPAEAFFNLSNNYFSGAVTPALMTRIQANSSLASTLYGNCLSSSPSSPAYRTECATVSDNICFLQHQRPTYQCLPYDALGQSSSSSFLNTTLAVVMLVLLAVAVAMGVCYACVKRMRQGRPKAVPPRAKVVVKAKEYKDVETGEIKAPPPDTYLPGMPPDIPRFSFTQLNEATDCFTHLANTNDPRAIYDATFLLPPIAPAAAATAAAPANSTSAPVAAAAAAAPVVGGGGQEHLSVQLVSFPGVYLDAMKEEFVARVKLIHAARHPCLFAFRGYAYEDGNFALVYEPTRETLFDRLHEASGAPLTWRERMVIALGVAEGLDFLHSSSTSHHTPPKSSTTPPHAATPLHHASTSPNSTTPLNDPHMPPLSGHEGSASLSVAAGTPLGSARGDAGQQAWRGGVVHGDVKSCNVVITAHSKGKLAEFQVPCDDADDPLRSISARGSFGYLDPQYADTKRLTAASDVYSFGILLFELVSGRRAMLDDSSTLIVWVQQFFMRRDDYPGLLDGALVTMGGVPPSQLVPVIELAQDCTQVREESRPTIQQVREVLMSTVGVEGGEVYESGSVVGYGDGESDTTISHLDEGLVARRAADHAALESAAAAVLAAVAAGGAARQTLEVYDHRVHSQGQAQPQQQQQRGEKSGGEIEIEMMSEGSEEEP
ncbi:hypothetical protein CLOM_g15783 [Closterium sp. NIES-68]|nr:hypothetical protein CLOM_g15783 [Closterium sp. NIES-68]GJP78767.1 hypothetical protein CLOP_g9042 [Closterium sp. NIES-67]